MRAFGLALTGLTVWGWLGWLGWLSWRLKLLLWAKDNKRQSRGSKNNEKQRQLIEENVTTATPNQLQGHAMAMG